MSAASQSDTANLVGKILWYLGFWRETVLKI